MRKLFTISELKLRTVQRDEGDIYTTINGKNINYDNFSIRFHTDEGFLGMDIRSDDNDFNAFTGIDVEQAEMLHAYLSVLLKNEVEQGD